MSKVYTHNYLEQYTAMAHGQEDFMDYYTAQFEREAADYLQQCTRDDVGAVILYYRAGEEVAYFDYENLVGSVYALGGTTASYCP
jgi:hypothetical protein